MLASAALRNSSAAVSCPGVSAAHAAPAAPSGQGGWTIECSSGGTAPAAGGSASVASAANALAWTADHEGSSVAAGASEPLMYGAAAFCASACSSVPPDSSISHTFV